MSGKEVTMEEALFGSPESDAGAEANGNPADGVQAPEANADGEATPAPATDTKAQAGGEGNPAGGDEPPAVKQLKELKDEIAKLEKRRMDTENARKDKQTKFNQTNEALKAAQEELAKVTSELAKNKAKLEVLKESGGTKSVTDEEVLAALTDDERDLMYDDPAKFIGAFETKKAEMTKTTTAPVAELEKKIQSDESKAAAYAFVEDYASKHHGFDFAKVDEFFQNDLPKREQKAYFELLQEGKPEDAFDYIYGLYLRENGETRAGAQAPNLPDMNGTRRAAAKDVTLPSDDETFDSQIGFAS